MGAAVPAAISVPWLRRPIARSESGSHIFVECVPPGGISLGNNDHLKVSVRECQILLFWISGALFPAGGESGSIRGRLCSLLWLCLEIVWRCCGGQTAKDTLKYWNRVSPILRRSASLLPVHTLPPVVGVTFSRCQAHSSWPPNKTY